MMKIEGLSCVWETGIVGRMHWNTELTCFLVGDSFYEFAMFFIWLLNCFFFLFLMWFLILLGYIEEFTILFKCFWVLD